VSALLQLVATVLVGAAVVAGLATLAGTRRPVLALGVLLELLLAAGLLRLAAVDDWTGIATAVAIVVIRRFVSAAYRRGARAVAASQ
jgi:hypothetical protein